MPDANRAGYRGGDTAPMSAMVPTLVLIATFLLLMLAIRVAGNRSGRPR